MEVQIVEGALTEALEVLKKLPEFDTLLANEYYFDKIEGSPNLVLLAQLDAKTVACKVGYDKYKDGSFYSWLGGVIPEFRTEGIARKLANAQESWARKRGYKSIKFKTLNRHKAMIIFAVKNGFEIYNLKPKDELENYRIEMIKDLL